MHRPNENTLASSKCASRQTAVGDRSVVNAESARELDDLITSLPGWPRVESEATPLTGFDGRMPSLPARLGNLDVQARETVMPALGGGR